MFAIGRRHLEWPIQPPLAPAPAGLADGIGPGSLIELRLPAVLATACAAVVAGLRRAAARAAVFGESYIVAAYLDGYSERYQLPDAYSTNRSYGYLPPAARRPRRGALHRSRSRGALTVS